MIRRPPRSTQSSSSAASDVYKRQDKTVVKFVPASGAASRMFKNLFEFLSADYDRPTTKFEQTFFDGIKNFAFYDCLLYTSDAADDLLCVDLGGLRIITKKTKKKKNTVASSLSTALHSILTPYVVALPPIILRAFQI